VNAPGRLPKLALAAFAAPGLGLSLLIAPFPALIAAFYAQHTAATAAGIATVLLVTRLLDAAVDPIVGLASDRTHSRLGGRKPWIMGGAVVGTVALGVLFQPRAASGNAYFAAGMMLYYVALATIDIPLRAWAGELAPDYRSRARIAGALTFTILAGGLLFLLLPDILALPAVGITQSAELDRETMGVIGRVGMIVLPATIALAIVLVPASHAQSDAEQGLRALLSTVRSNRPYWIFLAGDGATQVAWGVTYAVFIVALQTYYGLGEYVALILVGATLAQILAIPLCAWTADRIGRHRTWAWSSVVCALLLPFAWLFPAGQTSAWSMGLFVAVLSVFGTPNMMFPMAMVSDVADYGTLKSRQHRNGSYYAFRMFCYKATFALGNAVGFYGLSVAGYDPRAAVNGDAATTGMLALLVIVPAVFNLLTGLVLLRFPIDARRHAIIRRRIDRRRVA